MPPRSAPRPPSGDSPRTPSRTPSPTGPGSTPRPSRSTTRRSAATSPNAEHLAPHDGDNQDGDAAPLEADAPTPHQEPTPDTIAVLERRLSAEHDDARAIELHKELIAAKKRPRPCTCARCGAHAKNCLRYVPGHDLASPVLALRQYRAETAPDAEYRTVVLCGSLRHRQALDDAAWEETLAGHLVLRPDAPPPGVDGWAAAQAAGLDLTEQHFAKIRKADEVVVVGKPGEHTQLEIDYAERIGRPVRYVPAAKSESRDA